MPRRAMLFAAGLGTRMRPLTEHTPKALIPLGGKPLIDHALERFEAAGVERVVVNTHHLGDKIVAHLATRPSRLEVLVSTEEVLLETGGGLVKALPLLGDAPIFTANLDTLWLDGAVPALERLRQTFDPARMDVLLLLEPRARAVGYGGGGDFDVAPSGELVRRAGERPYVATGLTVLNPRLLAGRAAERFSVSELWLRSPRADGSLPRRHGLVHDGGFLHVGTPAELEAAERYLEARGAAARPAPR